MLNYLYLKGILISIFCMCYIDTNINNNIITPEFEFHDRRLAFQITCRVPIINDNIKMIFYYQNKTYVVPKLYKAPGVYKGNFSVVSTDQNKVLVMCINNDELLISKLYLLGYPPSFISQQFALDLNCRDFNLNRMVCCLRPNMTAIEQLLGFEDNRNGEFVAKLYFSAYENTEMTVNRSCYQLTKQTLAPTTSLHIYIANVLGNFFFDFLIDRMSIQKPNMPKYFLVTKNVTSFDFFIDLFDYGEYTVNVSCYSSRPIITFKNFSFNMAGIRSETISSSAWHPNSKITCTFFAKVRFGNDTIGQSSEKLTVDLMLTEGVPSRGPYVSSSLVDYSYSISDGGVLTNITVYFTNIDLKYRNGEIINFKWKCKDCFFNKKNVSSIVHNISARNRFFKLDHAMIGSQLSMTACTKQGCGTSWNSFQFRLLKDSSFNPRLYVVKDQNNQSNFIIGWYHQGTTPLFLLICEYVSEDKDCASIDNVILSENENKYEYFQYDDNIQIKFALLSSIDTINHKLQWLSCFYKSLSLDEATKKLQTLDYGKLTNAIMICDFYLCRINLRIRIPSCEEFPDIYFDKFRIIYNSGKAITKQVGSKYEIEFTLSGLHSGWENYVVQVSAITRANITIPWFQTNYKTDFLCKKYVSFVVMAVIIFVVVMVASFSRFKKKIVSQLEKKSDTGHAVYLTTNNAYETIVVPCNTQNKDLCKRELRGENNRSSKLYCEDEIVEDPNYKESFQSKENLVGFYYENLSKTINSRSYTDKSSTSTTSFESSEVYKRSSEERLVDFSGHDSLQYCDRPDASKMPALSC